MLRLRMTTIAFFLSCVVATHADETEVSKQLVQLYELGKTAKRRPIFNTDNYPKLRRIHSRDFESRYATGVDNPFGEKSDAIVEWLSSHSEIKEEFFLAIQPEYDDVAKTFKVFGDLWRKSPDQLENFASLAIATSVVWDNERKGKYNYSRHARRIDKGMPKGLTDAVENFEYLVRIDPLTGRRIRFVPWEMLTIVCNHETPNIERNWAIKNYLAKRVDVGKCYKDVPYRSNPNGVGQEYNFITLKQFGGVCAHQADYSSRVAKSLGVPAAYVSGRGRHGGSHAWVMWVDIKVATPSRVNFEIKDKGRYRSDHYYVGRLTDPQTGKRITDRQLELRMHTVGLDAIAKRHADLLMRSYPKLSEALSWKMKDKIEFLADTIAVCPGSEQAWIELAKIPSTEDSLTPKEIKTFQSVLATLFDTFQAFPDFTLTVFDDLIQFESSLSGRIAYYLLLLDLYCSAKRPDLAMTAQLKLTDMLCEDNRESEAIERLANTIRVFRKEGQYVPKLLDRLDRLALESNKEQLLAQFYSQFVPTIPVRRNKKPSKYCVSMHNRAIKVFREQNLNTAAAAFQTRVALIEAGRLR